MSRISECKVNSLTKKHIARVLKKLEEEYDVPYWIKQEIKKEFWLHNQNLKTALYKQGLIDLDDYENPWNPEQVEAILEGDEKDEV